MLCWNTHQFIQGEEEETKNTLVELKVIVIHWLFRMSDPLPGHSLFVFLYIFDKEIQSEEK